MTDARLNLELFNRRIGDWEREVDSVAASGVARALRRPQRQPSGTSPGDRRRIDQFLQRFEEMAALSGRFSPDDVFEEDDPEEFRQTVLSMALPRHTVETREGTLRWFLLPQARRAVVNRLAQADLLATRLGEPLPETDLYGRMLREVLRKPTAIALKSQSREELRALKGVLDDLQGVSVPLPDGNEIRRWVKADAFLGDYQVIVDGFVGRTKELRQLNDFLEKPPEPGAWPNWQSLVVTGVGGAGKSALLARLASELVHRGRASVVVLDFDRPGISAADTTWLQSEIARQLGDQYPEFDQPLRAARRGAYGVQARTSRTVQSDLEKVSFDRSSDDLMYQVRQLLQAKSGRPFLLILDTLEEIASSEAHYLLKWLDFLAEIFQPMPLKVVFSGRLFDETLDLFKARALAGGLTLDELPWQSARALLTKQGISRVLANKIVRSRLLPKRPLELRLLARLAEDGGFSVEELENKLSGKSNVSVEAARAIIYQRVLSRLGRGLVQKLASPGLVLRYLTPELVQRVLVPALDLPIVGAREAEETLQELAAHTWLVTSGADGKLWHRKELRRSMLRLIVATEEETARRISTEAARFFEEGGEEERAEAVYHRLLMMRRREDGEEFDLAELANANRYIRSDWEDLPAPAAALLRFATTKTAATDVVLLPDRYFYQACHSTGRRLARAGEWGQALKLLERKPLVACELESWEADTLFATAEWDRLPPSRFLSPSGAETPRFLERFANALYPCELVEPSLTADVDVEGWLGYGAGREDLRSSSADLGSSLCRLGVSLVLLNERRPLSPQARRNLGTILRLVEALENKPRSALVEHRLSLLRLLSDAPRVDSWRVGPSTLMLRLTSIEAMLGRSGLRVLRDLETAVDQLCQATRPLTAKAALSAVDALYKDEQWQTAQIRLGSEAEPHLLAMLRGPDVDYRDPVRFAILAEFTSSDDYERVAAIFRECVEFPVADLKPEPFIRAMEHDAEHALAFHVELVDRCWNLGRCLDLLRRERPESSRLERIWTEWRRWDRAIGALLQSHFPEFPAERV